MKKSPNADIVSVGNELLIGHTLDTNSHWIAKRFTKFGWTLQRITVLRDSLPAIKDGVTGALRRKPDLLITLGGLTCPTQTARAQLGGLRHGQGPLQCARGFYWSNAVS